MEFNVMEFKVGTYDLHPEANFNFQLNRMVMYADGDLEEVKEAARKITDMASWVSTFLELGERALQEGRTGQAISYFRGAEFFMYGDIQEKHRIYERAMDLFYATVIARCGSPSPRGAWARYSCTGVTTPARRSFSGPSCI